MRGMRAFFCVDDHWLRTLAGACRRSVCGLPALRLRLAALCLWLQGRNSVQKDVSRKFSSMEETWSIIC